MGERNVDLAVGVCVCVIGNIVLIEMAFPFDRDRVKISCTSFFHGLYFRVGYCLVHAEGEGGGQRKREREREKYNSVRLGLNLLRFGIIEDVHVHLSSKQG